MQCPSRRFLCRIHCLEIYATTNYEIKEEKGERSTLLNLLVNARTKNQNYYLNKLQFNINFDSALRRKYTQKISDKQPMFGSDSSNNSKI